MLSVGVMVNAVTGMVVVVLLVVVFVGMVVVVTYVSVTYVLLPSVSGAVARH